MHLTMKVSEQECFRITAQEAWKDFDPMELRSPAEVPVFDKYDEYVPQQLVRKGFAAGVLDIERMKQRVLSWSENRNSTGM